MLSRVLGLVIISLACWSCNQQSVVVAEREQNQTTTSDTLPNNRVIALGRLLPDGEIIKLSVPNAEDSRVNQVLVKEGEFVQAGDIIAILQGYKRKKLDLEEARKTVEFFEAQLAKIWSGTSNQSEVDAQEANIRRLESMQKNEILERQAKVASVKAALIQDTNEYKRNLKLYNAGVITQITLEQSHESLVRSEAAIRESQAQLDNTLQTMQEEINREKKVLSSLREVRPEDVRIAQVELERSKVAVQQRQADLEDTIVRVPVSGQIMRINTRVGERVNTQEGIVELGQTKQMYALAEIYETDVSKIKKGQMAILSSEYGGFEGDVKGIIEHISLQIGKRTLSEGGENPFDNVNTRIVEARIKINPAESQKVASLTNMQVRVEILLNE